MRESRGPEATFGVRCEGCLDPYLCYFDEFSPMASGRGVRKQFGFSDLLPPASESAEPVADLA